MPTSIATLRGTPVPLLITLEDGSPVNVTYWPRAVTPRYEAALADLSEGTERPAKQASILLKQLIDTWDLKGFDGDELPCTVEGMADVPTKDTMHMIGEVLKAGNPKATSAETSPAG